MAMTNQLIRDYDTSPTRHCLRFRGWDGQDLARNSVPSGEHTQLRARARVVRRVAPGDEVAEVAVGLDGGVVVLKLGQDEPSYSMHPSGKLIYTRASEVLTFILQPRRTRDLRRTIPLPRRELGSTQE